MTSPSNNPENGPEPTPQNPSALRKRNIWLERLIIGVLALQVARSGISSVLDDQTEDGQGEGLPDGEVDFEKISAEYIGDIPYFSERFVRYSVVETFRTKYTDIWTGMQEQDDYNEAHRDSFVLMDAITQGDKEKALEIAKKYKKSADFLPAYFMKASEAGVKEMVDYAKEEGEEKALELLLEDGPNAWNHRKELLTDMEEKAAQRQRRATEVWTSCDISQDPDTYANFPGRGPALIGRAEIMEDTSTAGQLAELKDKDGEAILDAYGMPCLMPKTYAEELEAANECLYEKTKEEMRARYCYRSAYMQAVVRSSIKKSPLHKCDGDKNNSWKDRLKRKIAKATSLLAGGDDMAAPPGRSPHVFGAIDLNHHGESQVLSCLPSYWKPLEGDPGHYEIKTDKPSKPGECTTVKGLKGKERQFCFGKAPEVKKVTKEELPPEGEYRLMPLGSVREGDLVRVTNAELKKVPQVIGMSEKIVDIEANESKGKAIPYHAFFLYQIEGAPFFCRLEEHDRSRLKIFSGKPVGKHPGCSTFRYP